MWQQQLEEAIKWHKKGSYDKAEELYRKVLSMVPDQGDALHLLGLLYSLKNQTEDARINLEKAASLFPDNPLFCNDLGVFYFNTGNLEKAEGFLQQTIALQPDHAQALFYLGNIRRKMNNFPKAAEFYEKAVSGKPDFIPALCNLGTAYSEMDRYEEAISIFRKTASLAPNLVEPYNNLGLLYAKTGSIEQALSYYHKAHSTHPYEHRIFSNILFYSNYLPDISNDDLFSLHRQFQTHYEKMHKENTPRRKAADKNKKLRIGYVSADFRTHSVGYFIEPIITFHNKKNYETYCYSDTPIHDETTERIMNNTSFWRPIHACDDDTVFTMIQKDEIDILVDLAGHTENNRLSLFMKRPAPVQITYLGYPNTTGLAAMDYRLTDTRADPDGSDKFYTEKLVRFENSFLCYRPPDNLPSIKDLPATKNGYITFGSFNNLPKINKETIAVWARILQKVPDSKLFLKTKPFTNGEVCKQYLKLFGHYDISETRLTLQGHNPIAEEHLNEYNMVDIALDPFPYNGTTTTFEALLMGVPVVTLEGNRHAGRVGVSILTALGTPELIALSPEEFIAIAAEFAKDRTRLADFHQQLRGKLLTSVLCDGKKFAGNLEKIYTRIRNEG